MKKKISRYLYFILLLLAILPYNYSALFLNKGGIIITIITYIIRIILVLYVLFYMKKLELSSSEKKVFKIISIYFFFIFALNVVSSIVNSSISYKEILIRTFSMMYMYGFYIYIIYNYKNFDSFQRVLKNVCVFLLIISIFLYYFFPEIGRMYEGFNSYVLLGVASNRNSFFELITPAIISILYLNGENKLRLIDFIPICVIVFSIIMTKSATSIISIFLLLILTVMNRIVKDKRKLLKLCIFVLLILWLGYFIIITTNKNIGDFSLLFANKSTTLSGRTFIWQKALYFIKEKPIIGYGYDNTIIGDNNNYLFQLDNSFPNDTHNSLLFMMLSSGVIGTVGLLFIIGKTLARGITVVSYDKDMVFLMYFIIVDLVRGLTESCFHYPHLIFFLYMIIINIKYYEIIKEKK